MLYEGDNSILNFCSPRGSESTEQASWRVARRSRDALTVTKPCGTTLGRVDESRAEQVDTAFASVSWRRLSASHDTYGQQQRRAKSLSEVEAGHVLGEAARLSDGRVVVGRRATCSRALLLARSRCRRAQEIAPLRRYGGDFSICRPGVGIERALGRRTARESEPLSRCAAPPAPRCCAWARGGVTILRGEFHASRTMRSKSQTKEELRIMER